MSSLVVSSSVSLTPTIFWYVPKTLEEQQKERIGKEMTNVSLFYNAKRTMGIKIETRMKERFRRKLSLYLQKDSNSGRIVQLNQLL